MSVFIDLSHSIEEKMPVYPGTLQPSFKEFANIRHEGFRESILSFSTHTGTHIDAEAHLFEKGKTIDKYAIDCFYGKALVIDCSENKTIETDLLHNVLKETILPDFILFYTGWDKYWGKEEYYTQYPVLSTSAAKYLGKLSLKGLGIDTISFDTFDNLQLTNHKILLKKDLVLIENLHGLHKIIGRDCIFMCFPLYLMNCDSSPVRACALIE